MNTLRPCGEPIKFYDANGSLMTNLNKGLSTIRYNCLNLPESMQFYLRNMINYSYDAAGVKRKAGGLTPPVGYGVSFRKAFPIMMLFLTMSYNPLFSQNKKDIRDILTSKVWGNYYDGYVEGGPQVRYIFTNDSVTCYTVGKKGFENMKFTYPYYLSDQKDNYFDDRKIGKVKNGKYLCEKSINIYIMEMISIDENEIKFKAPTANEGDVIRIYRAVD